jgi:hypothetical protein
MILYIDCIRYSRVQANSTLINKHFECPLGANDWVAREKKRLNRHFTLLSLELLFEIESTLRRSLKRAPSGLELPAHSRLPCQSLYLGIRIEDTRRLRTNWHKRKGNCPELPYPP